MPMGLKMKSFEAALFPPNKQLATPGCKKSDSINLKLISPKLNEYTNKHTQTNT